MSSDRDRVMKLGAANWWLRSSNNTNNIGNVNSAGGFNNNNATNSNAVRPASLWFAGIDLRIQNAR